MIQDIIRELRHKHGISQQELAKALGVSSGNVGDWERGRSKPGYDAIATLSTFFNVSCDYLIKGQEPDSTDHLVLTEIECDIILKYRQLPNYAQEDLLDNIKAKYNRAFQNSAISSTSKNGKKNKTATNETA